MVSWLDSANTLTKDTNRGRPDYLMIAILEAEVWGEVFTKESKKFAMSGPVRDRVRQRGYNDTNAGYVDSMLADLGME